MTEIIGTVVVRLVMLVVLVATCGLTVLAITVALKGPSWVSVLFQLGERPIDVRGPLIASFVATAAIGLLSFETPGLSAAMLAWVLLAPRYVGWRARVRAWASDDPASRMDALAVRNRLRELRQEELLSGDAPWPEYIMDAAKAKRQRLYQRRFDRAEGQEATAVPVARV